MPGAMYNQGVFFKAKDGVSPTLNRIARNTNTASAAMYTYGTQINRVVRNLPAAFAPFRAGKLVGAGMLAGTAALYGTARGLRTIVEETGRFEVANIQFSKLIGNAELAQKTLREMEIFAARTPFEFKQSQEISKGLLAAGVDAKGLIPTMKMLGDLGMGNPEKVEQLALAYSKVRMTGKATWRELRMFATAGVPIFAAMQKQLNLNQAGLEKFVRQGKAKFPELEKALQSLSGPTGKFHGMMVQMMATIPGLWSNFLDVVGMVQRRLGGTFQDSLKQVNIQLTALGMRVMEWIELNEEFLRQNIGGFLEGVAEGLKNLEVTRLFEMARGMWNLATGTLKTIFWLKVFTSAVEIASKATAGFGAIKLLLSKAMQTYVMTTYASVLATQALGVAAVGTGTAMWAAFWPILIIVGALALALAGIWSYFQKLRGVSFTGKPLGGFEALQGMGSEFKSVYDFDMPNTPNLKSGLASAEPISISNLTGVSQIERTNTPNLKSGLASAEPISISNLTGVSQIERTNTKNSNTRVTLALSEGLTADAEGDLPPGIDLMNLDRGSILAG